jgi:TatA/E family protein of Tat protein translocase
MFSVPDIMVVSVLALLLFGPDQLPKMMRQFGRVMREVQNTSQGFIAEMERAADLSEQRATAASASPVAPVERPLSVLPEPVEAPPPQNEENAP